MDNAHAVNSGNDPSGLDKVSEVKKSKIADLNDKQQRRTHEPIIVLPDRIEIGQRVGVKVKVGMIPHEMLNSHYIKYIKLMVDDRLIGQVELNPGKGSVPEADFEVNLKSGMNLEAYANCNVHGEWTTHRKIS